jgi:hypothetical protein
MGAGEVGDAGCSHKGTRAITCLLRRDSPTLGDNLEELALGEDS